MKKARKMSDSKLGFEVGSGLKKSQSRYSYEGTCKLYGAKKDKGGTTEKLYNLFCENCGCRFQSKNPSKRFHSPSCASLFIARKRMEERDGKTEKEEQ